MKQLLFAVLLLFSYRIMAQNNLRLMGLGSGLSHYKGIEYNPAYVFPYSNVPYEIDDISIYYHYYSLHQIKNTPFYFTIGSKLLINPIGSIAYAYQRFGLSKKDIMNGKRIIYFGLGGELSTQGLGGYANINILYKLKKNYIVVSPEIDYVCSNYYNGGIKIGTISLLNIGVGVAMGWDKKEFSQKKERTHVITNHYNVDVTIASLRTYRDNENQKGRFIHISTGYRIFSKQIISPEVGVGFIAKYNPSEIMIVREGGGHWDLHYYYIASQDYIPYVKLGFSLQTKAKLAFIANASVFEMLTFAGNGYIGKIGVKYAISNKLAISFCPEVVHYQGETWGWTKIYREIYYGQANNTDIITKGRHYSQNKIYNFKLGMHF